MVEENSNSDWDGSVGKELVQQDDGDGEAHWVPA